MFGSITFSKPFPTLTSYTPSFFFYNGCHVSNSLNWFSFFQIRSLLHRNTHVLSLTYSLLCSVGCGIDSEPEQKKKNVVQFTSGVPAYREFHDPQSRGLGAHNSSSTT